MIHYQANDEPSGKVLTMTIQKASNDFQGKKNKKIWRRKE